MGENYLIHHGILGQKWGHKQGPPYPLGSGDHSSAEKSAAKSAGVKVGKDSGKGSIDKATKKRQDAEYNLAKKTQTKLYRSSYDRMNDYSAKSKIVNERSKELSSLSDKAKELDLKLDDFRESDKVTTLAWKNATERCKKEIKDFDSYSEKDKSKIIETTVYDLGELNKAVKQVCSNDPEYKQLKTEYNSTIKEYKNKCHQITNEIIGEHGKEKISGLGTDMNYEELVYYALSKPNTMWMFTYQEDMGRK